MLCMHINIHICVHMYVDCTYIYICMHTHVKCKRMSDKFLKVFLKELSG